jgi:hypothetical protein
VTSGLPIGIQAACSWFEEHWMKPAKISRNSNFIGSRRQQKQIRLWPAVLILILVVTVIVLQVTGLLKLHRQTAETTTPTTQIPAATPTPQESTTTLAEPTLTPTPTEPPEIRVTLAAVGDIILHQAVIDGGLVSGSSPATYDFRPIFQYIRSILSASDITLANYEGTLAGAPYHGYPFFCGPDQIADALLDTGVDVVWTANNHTIDRGLAGVVRTATVFREKGFTVVGTRPDETTPADAVLDIGGIRVGFLAYTFETIGTETQKALNGISMPVGADPLIDSFNPYREASFTRDIGEMLSRAAHLREQGAEMICLSLHWGNEYKTRSSAYQRNMAQKLADAGIELIIGHHPHVLEEIEVLQSATTKRPTLVFYSLGNFVHNMDFDTHDSKGYAQDAVIARIHLLKKEGSVTVESAEYIPTYVVRVAKGDNLVQHLVVPVLPALADPAAYQTTAAEMQASLDRTNAVLAESKGNGQIPVRESGR